MEPQTNNLTTLLARTYTVSDLRQKLQFLKLYLERSLFGSVDTKSFNSQDLTWFSTLPPEFLKNFSQQNLEQSFADLEKKLDIIKPLTIFIPSELPPQSIRDICLKLRKDYGSNFLIDLKIDPNLIAGCALVWNGVYRDYSLRSRIDTMRDDVLSILKKWK